MVLELLGVKTPPKFQRTTLTMTGDMPDQVGHFFRSHDCEKLLGLTPSIIDLEIALERFSGGGRSEKHLGGYSFQAYNTVSKRSQ